jgi:hypothetical protein
LHFTENFFISLDERTKRLKFGKSIFNCGGGGGGDDDVKAEEKQERKRIGKTRRTSAKSQWQREWVREREREKWERERKKEDRNVNFNKFQKLLSHTLASTAPRRAAFLPPKKDAGSDFLSSFFLSLSLFFLSLSLHASGLFN